MKPIPELCDDALSVQDACNLMAVANGFSRALSDLKGHGVYGDALREHPVTVLWVNKIDSMVRSDDRFSDAYDFCINNLPCKANVPQETGEE